MSTFLPTSTRVHDAENQNASQQHRRDAGTLFVLKSKGSWIHCGYHLTTSIVSPSLLSLPYALTFLGWKAGIFCLVIGAFVSFYSFNLISLVLEHHAYLGNRHLLYRDMARDILGPRWGRYFVGPIQFAVCYNNEVLCALLGGQCMKAIYLLSNPNGTMKLYEFVVIFGCFMLILAQMPSFHSLRHINLVSSVMCLSYSACATAASIYIGKSSNAPEKDYSLKGDTTNRLFGIFNAIPIIATTYGSGIIPEIQATLAPPVKGKMLRSLCACYVVVLFSFFCVAISGYWAFGNQAEGLIFSSFVDSNKPLAPKWLIYMPNICTIAQLIANGAEYLQPTNVILEQIFGDPESPEFSPRNVIPRLISRSLAVITATTIAAMLPFFGDMNSLIGAFGYMPLDFILPMIFFNMTFKPSKRSPILWLNVVIVIAFSALAAMATISTVRQIVLDAKTYRLFANRNEYAASNLNNSTRSREPNCFSTTSSKRCRHSLCPQIKRFMDSLWLPLDNFNCVSITTKSSLCFNLPRMEGRNTLFGHWSSGPRWARFLVGPIQFALCYNNQVLCALLGGQCMKAIYLLLNPNGTMKLYEFVVIFGCFMLILAQMPSFHSLRHINLVSLVMCLSYSACATAASIYIGNTSKGPEKDYSLKGDTKNRLFGIFNAIAIIATTYGNISTSGKREDVQDVFFMLYLYSLSLALPSLAIGHFGNQVAGLILSNFVDNGKPLFPNVKVKRDYLSSYWANSVVYLQPTNDVVLEKTSRDPEISEFSPRNIDFSVISYNYCNYYSSNATFFWDINSLIGAFGFMPLDFILLVECIITLDYVVNITNVNYIKFRRLLNKYTVHIKRKLQL
ncbi:GABA transporter 1 [Glycine max]|nr:GABA transporter 1 [Glycine max]